MSGSNLRKPDDTIFYWLCCGLKSQIHDNNRCHELRIGNTEVVRYGTAKQHSDWQIKGIKK